MEQHYGEHNSHEDWMRLVSGKTIKHRNLIGEKDDIMFTVDINDEEAELMTKQEMDAFNRFVIDTLNEFKKIIK